MPKMISSSFFAFILFIGLSSVYSNIADFDCFERADSGPGRAYMEVFAWQSRNKTCTKFVYGGLLGNRNKFGTIEDCTRSCQDAVLRKQLNFDSSRRYNVVNRLYETIQIALNVEQVDNDYFKLIVQPSGKLLSVASKEKTSTIETQELNGSDTQHWDIIPTGEKDYYRIQTRTRAASNVDFMFLEVSQNDTKQVDLARRDNLYLGQQWRFV